MTREFTGMTQNEMFAELCHDIRDLRKRVEEANDDNHEAHLNLQKQLSTIEGKAGINAAKIAFIAGIAAVVSSGVVAAAMTYIV